MAITSASYSIIVPAYNAAKSLNRCLTLLRVAKFSEFELIVVDDGSSDDTAAIAKELADRVIPIKHAGLCAARRAGAEAAKGSILIFIDSDVFVAEDTLEMVVRAFGEDPETGAITGRLSSDPPVEGWPGIYKHLYMNFAFSHLAGRVSFLYGSIFAVRSEFFKFYGSSQFMAEDTEFGLTLTEQGVTIQFLPHLEVGHQKEFTVKQLLVNDFKIAYRWGKLFWKHGGWKQLFKGKKGFAHASDKQLLSLIVLCGLFWPALLLSLFAPQALLISAILLVGWFVINYPMFRFMFKKRGLVFAALAVPFTFIDQHAHASGAALGLL